MNVMCSGVAWKRAACVEGLSQRHCGDAHSEVPDPELIVMQQCVARLSMSATLLLYEVFEE